MQRQGGPFSKTETTTTIKEEEEDLLHWVRRIVARSTARFLYGDRNPVAVARSRKAPGGDDLETGFWDFDQGLGRLLVGIWPRVTARKAYRGREKLVAGFRAYLDHKHYEASPSGPPEEKDDNDDVLGGMRTKPVGA